MVEPTRESLARLIRDPALERLELMLQHPNLFYILKLENAEIRHSSFLAWLLNPQGSHQLGSLFLKHFLRGAFAHRSLPWIDEFKVDQLDLDTVLVRREWQRIDLLIETPQFVIAIENKILSGEHSNQLKRYRDVLERAFPDRKKGYVFLTPEATSPTEEDDQQVWNQYSYEDIAATLGSVLEIHGTSLSPRVRTYIEDYLLVLRREIMVNDELIQLAKSIYESHREAMDLILEHRPDRLSEVASIFEDLVLAEGWVLASRNKGYTRFLTPGLDKVIPRTGTGWPLKEAFVFEFDYWPKHITFRAAISPGDEAIRKVISGAIKGLAGAGTPRGEVWVAYFKQTERFDVTDLEHTDDQIRAKIQSMFKEVRQIAASVEAAILGVKDKLASDQPR